MEELLTIEALIALLTLTFLEVVLGIDNVIFVSIVSNKLPGEQQRKARNLGLSLAMIFRILLLLGISWITKFTAPLFTVFATEISGRDLILAVGGLFLIFKSTVEIGQKMGGETGSQDSKVKATMASVISQIIVLDVIFSFDSILTAVGLTDQIALMVTAVLIAMIIMMVFAGKISDFIHQNPTLEILALSFLILIGFMLVVDAVHYHIPKGYIYFAVFFSLGVEVINMRMRKRRQPVKLHRRFSDPEK